MIPPVDARDSIQIPLVLHVPVVHSIGTGGDEGFFHKLGHLGSDEDLTKELLLGGSFSGNEIWDCGERCRGAGMGRVFLVHFVRERFVGLIFWLLLLPCF